MSTTRTKVGEVSARLDRLPRSKFHYRLLAVNGIAWAFDAFDVALITFVVARLNSSWQLTPAETGFLLSSGLFGMLAGAIIAGPLADRFGRKCIFQWTLFFFSIFSLASAYVPIGEVFMLAVCRFLVGVGLGGETPVVVSLLGEFVPSKHRGKVQGLMTLFWSLGWLCAAAVALIFIPNLGPDSLATAIVPGGEGWRVAFIVGALPALYIFYIRRKLPESPRWLAGKGQIEAALKIVEDIENEVRKTHEIPPVNEADVIRFSQQPVKLPISTLFKGEYLRRTLVLWSFWFFSMAGFYGLFAWLPSLLNRMGHSLDNAFLQILLMQVFYMPNQVVSSYLMDRIGRKPVMIFNMVGSAITALWYGWAIQNGSSSMTVLIIGCIVSYFVSGVYAVGYTYSPEMYPTSIRVTGAAWASAASRLGSMFMPTIIGFIVVGTNVFPAFILISAIFIIPAVIVAIWGIETKGLSLDETSISH